MIRLMIVDDSALMRKHLVSVFEQEGGFEMCVCRNGLEALEELHSFKPDVITLDINMPEMDGLTALSRIMAERPTPVVMVSSLTEKGALATFEALNLGAVDYVAKPGGTISLNVEKISLELIQKVYSALKAKVRNTRGLSQRLREETQRIQRQPLRKSSGKGVVLIGVSTGGPRTLEEILPLLPADFPWPVVVAQHMPANFTLAFANRMNGMCALTVQEVDRLVMPQPGNIYIGKGGADLIFSKRPTGICLMTKPETPEFLWHPSVELLVQSALNCYPASDLIGVMLTGMGYDGAEAMARLKNDGGRTIAESEETAVVFGMPAELIARQGATVVARCDKIAQQLNRWAFD